MKVEDILRRKGRSVVVVSPAITIAELAAELARWKVGALVVSTDGKAAEGIVSERDIVHALSTEGTGLLSLPVSRIMTRDVRSCAPEDDLQDIMERMTDGRFRHMPVIRHNLLVGIVSIGDVVKARIEEAETEASHLRNFIAGG